MDLHEAFAASPFMQLLSIELLKAGDGRATGRVEFVAVVGRAWRCVRPGWSGVHARGRPRGRSDRYTNWPQSVTVGMRIDYLSPAVTDLHAEAVVRWMGDSIAVVDIEVTDTDDEPVATARGTFWNDTGYAVDETSAEVNS